MARYIDAEKLKTNIRVNLMPNVDIDGTVTVENAERYFLNIIDKTTTADVVEVVRCKDCVWCDKDSDPQTFLCGLASGDDEPVAPSYFCASGRRER